MDKIIKKKKEKILTMCLSQFLYRTFFLFFKMNIFIIYKVVIFFLHGRLFC